MRIAAAFLLFAAASGPALAQMYKCTAPDGSTAFQDKPCPTGAKQSVPPASAGARPSAAPGAKARPAQGMSEAQAQDYRELMRSYIDTFRILGRSQACGRKPDQVQPFLEEIERRHGQKTDLIAIAIMGFAAGAENRSIGPELEGPTPPAPLPCDIAVGHLQNIRLPDLPASLVLREGEPLDSLVAKGNSSTGPYRFVKRIPPGGGAGELLLFHRDRIVHRSQAAYKEEFLMEGPTPVLLMSSLDQARKCRDGKAYTSWFAVSLPLRGEPVASKLDTDCMTVWPYTPPGGGRRALCGWINTEHDKRRSKLYAIDDAGKVVQNGERPVGVCPR